MDGNTGYGVGFDFGNNSGSGAVRKPGNFLTHLLPAVGGTLGAIIGTPADLFSGIGGTVAGGAGGSALGKMLENKFEHQSIGSGVAGQALIGGASGIGGELLGAGFNALKGAGQAGADVAANVAGDAASNAATEAGTNAATDTVAQVGKTTATQAGKQSLRDTLMSGINGVTPDALQGPAVGNVGEAARINSFLNNDLALRGSSSQRLAQLATKFDQSGNELGAALNSGKTTTLDTINQAVDNSIQAHPLNPGHPDIGGIPGRTPGSIQLSPAELDQAISQGSNPVATQFDHAGSTIKNIAAKMVKSAEPGTPLSQGIFSDAEVNTLRQQVDRLVNFNASPNASPDIMNEAARASRSSLNEILAANNPEARGIISQQADMIKGGDLLAKQSGYARAGVRIGGVRIPVNVGSGLEAVQSGLGVMAGNTAERNIPLAAQIAGQAIGNRVGGDIQQNETKQGLQGANTDLTSPGSDLTKQLQGYVPSDTKFINGLPSANEIKQLELQDLQTTGGKNYTMLSRLGTIASSQEKQQVLSPTAEKGITTYQQQLGTLQNIANAFQGNGNFNDVSNVMQQSIPDLQKATGLSAKQITAMLPNASERADQALQKLQQLKTLIDAKASDTLSATQSSATANDPSSLLASLLGAGATQ